MRERLDAVRIVLVRTSHPGNIGAAARAMLTMGLRPLALVAPRGLYVASASDDLWADPRGEFLAAQRVGPVYELLGKRGLGARAFPASDRPIGRTVRYHVRTGKHDITAYYWEQYLDFADAQWR